MNNKYIFKLQKLEHYVKQLNKFVATGRFKSMTAKKRKQIINRIKRLQRQLSLVTASKQVRRTLAAATVALGLAIAPAQAQFFTPAQISPFGLTSPSLYSFSTSKDLDGDGDYDILIAQYGGYAYYENIGTASAPSFATPVADPFGLTYSSVYITSFPELADIDGDGDYDLISSTVFNSAIQYFENTGTATAPAFAAPVTNPFGLVQGYGYSVPALGDLDGDGDLDLLYAENGGTLNYCENTGTATAPAFAAPVADPFGVVPGYSFTVFPKLVDIDGDGDLDIAYGYADAGTYIHENTGSASSPVFGAAMLDPFGLEGSASSVYLEFASPVFVDMDGDGDVDAMQGGYLYPAGFVYQAQNAPPVSADTSVYTIKNTAYTFSVDDFPYTDDSPTPTSMTVVSLPSDGMLDVSGTAVLAGDVIMAADIPNLTFTPDTDYVGSTAFIFSMQDDFSSSNVHIMIINVDAPASVANVLEDAQMVLAPNPVSDYLRVAVTGIEPSVSATLSIRDISGKVVHQEVVEPAQWNNKTIATSNLTNGVYFLTIETQEGILRDKFVKH